MTPETCPQCGGTKLCAVCAGTGKVVRDPLSIPALEKTPEKHPVEALIETCDELLSCLDEENEPAMRSALDDAKSWLAREKSIAKEALEAVESKCSARVFGEQCAAPNDSRIVRILCDPLKAEIDRQLEQLGKP